MGRGRGPMGRPRRQEAVPEALGPLGWGLSCTAAKLLATGGPKCASHHR